MLPLFNGSPADAVNRIAFGYTPNRFTSGGGLGDESRRLVDARYRCLQSGALPQGPGLLVQRRVERPEPIRLRLVAHLFFDGSDGEPGGALPVRPVAGQGGGAVGVLTRRIDAPIPQIGHGKTRPQVGIAAIDADGTFERGNGATVVSPE